MSELGFCHAGPVRVMIRHAGTEMPCAVSDLSAEGARLGLRCNALTTRRFELLLPGTTRPLRCEVVGRSNDEVGVRILPTRSMPRDEGAEDCASRRVAAARRAEPSITRIPNRWMTGRLLATPGVASFGRGAASERCGRYAKASAMLPASGMSPEGAS